MCLYWKNSSSSDALVGLTRFFLVGLSLDAEGSLTGGGACEYLWALPLHLETAKGQTAETLSLSWSAQDSSSLSSGTPLLKSYKYMKSIIVCV